MKYKVGDKVILIVKDQQDVDALPHSNRLNLLHPMVANYGKTGIVTEVRLDDCTDAEYPKVAFNSEKYAYYYLADWLKPAELKDLELLL